MILTKIVLMAIAIVLACYGTVTTGFRKAGLPMAWAGLLLFFVAMMI